MKLLKLILPKSLFSKLELFLLKRKIQNAKDPFLYK